MRRILGWLAWWIPLAALWLLLVDTTRTSELVAGAATAALGATAAELISEQRLLSFHVRPRWLRRTPYALSRLPVESWTVTAALIRHMAGRRVSGSFRVIPFRVGRQDPESTARRALAKSLDSLGPNNYVVGIDAEKDVMLVHQLVPPAEAGSADPMELGDPS